MKIDKDNLYIYSTGSHCYVRLAPLETNRFPHGISLANVFRERDEREMAEKFREDVREYLNEAGYNPKRLKLAEEVIQILLNLLSELPCGLDEMFSEEDMRKINEFRDC